MGSDKKSHTDIIDRRRENIKLNVKYALLQMLFWTCAASAYGYLTQMLQYKEFTEGQIGVINAVKLFSTVIFQIMIGAFSDRYAKRIQLKNIIAVLTAAALVLTFVFYQYKLSFIQTVVLFVGFGATFTCISPLIDSPTGRPGEIYAKGLGQMMSYYNAPEKTASVFSDGWYHTGDVGYLDEDNYLYLVGRMSDMIITGGENVYPKSVEECILALDGVENVAVIGVKDDHLGEAVTAVIVKSPNAELDEESVRNWCKGKIAGYMKPRKVFFVNELPVNSTGKVDKRKLTEMFE